MRGSFDWGKYFWFASQFLLFHFNQITDPYVCVCSNTKYLLYPKLDLQMALIILGALWGMCCRNFLYLSVSAPWYWMECVLFACPYNTVDAAWWLFIPVRLVILALTQDSWIFCFPGICMCKVLMSCDAFIGTCVSVSVRVCVCVCVCFVHFVTVNKVCCFTTMWPS